MNDAKVSKAGRGDAMSGVLRTVAAVLVLTLFFCQGEALATQKADVQAGNGYGSMMASVTALESRIAGMLSPVYGSSCVVVRVTASEGESGSSKDASPHIVVLIDSSSAALDEMPPEGMLAEQERLRSLVRHCAGISEAAADKIAVSFLPFAGQEEPRARRGRAGSDTSVMLCTCIALLAVLLLGAWGIVWRRKSYCPPKEGNFSGRGGCQINDKNVNKMTNLEETAGVAAEKETAPEVQRRQWCLRTLGKLLAAEHPQARALSLTLLDADAACVVSETWGEEGQADIMARLLSIPSQGIVAIGSVREDMLEKLRLVGGEDVVALGRGNVVRPGIVLAVGILRRMAPDARERLLTDMGEIDNQGVRILRDLLEA